MNANEEGSSEEEDDDKTSEEARKVHKRRHCDGPPTERERVEHARTHLPCRTWCPACVARTRTRFLLIHDLPRTRLSAKWLRMTIVF